MTLVEFLPGCDLMDASEGRQRRGELRDTRVLHRDIDPSAQGRATFARLIEHRRAIAATPTSVCAPNRHDASLFCDGYTLMHVATGITVSFFMQRPDFGGVLAKSYSNPFAPAYLNSDPSWHFYGYGVGRRLYLAAHVLWPLVRWEDRTSRSTSNSVRRWLHQDNPFIWEYRDCTVCKDDKRSWRTAPVEEIEYLHRAAAAHTRV